MGLSNEEEEDETEEGKADHLESVRNTVLVLGFNLVVQLQFGSEECPP